jgi:hypothetical protein
MNVSELIAILQTKNPLAAVVLYAQGSFPGYVEARSTEDRTMRAYFRDGSVFLADWDAELAGWPTMDVGNFEIQGVLIE